MVFTQHRPRDLPLHPDRQRQLRRPVLLARRPPGRPVPTTTADAKRTALGGRQARRTADDQRQCLAVEGVEVTAALVVVGAAALFDQEGRRLIPPPAATRHHGSGTRPWSHKGAARYGRPAGGAPRRGRSGRHSTAGCCRSCPLPPPSRRRRCWRRRRRRPRPGRRPQPAGAAPPSRRSAPPRAPPSFPPPLPALLLMSVAERRAGPGPGRRRPARHEAAAGGRPSRRAMGPAGRSSPRAGRRAGRGRRRPARASLRPSCCRCEKRLGLVVVDLTLPAAC